MDEYVVPFTSIDLLSTQRQFYQDKCAGHRMTLKLCFMDIAIGSCASNREVSDY